MLSSWTSIQDYGYVMLFFVVGWNQSTTRFLTDFFNFWIVVFWFAGFSFQIILQRWLLKHWNDFSIDFEASSLDGITKSIGRVTIGIHHGEDGNVQFLCFLHGDMLARDVHDEQSSWQSAHVTNGPCSFSNLARRRSTVKRSFERGVEGAVFSCDRWNIIFLQPTDGDKAGQHPTRPTLGNITISYFLAWNYHNVLFVVFGSDEKVLFFHWQQFFKASLALPILAAVLYKDDVDSIALHVDVWFMSDPIFGKVPKVNIQIRRSWPFCCLPFCFSFVLSR